MTDRGTYEVKVRVWTDRTITVDADGFDDAEDKAMLEARTIVDGYDPEVLYVVPIKYDKDDWPVDRADD